MRKITYSLLICLGLISFTAKSQYTYDVTGPLPIGSATTTLLQTTNTTNGFTDFHADNAGSTGNEWSSVYTLPFNFDLFGSPVSHFIVSKNFLLSFDTLLTGTAVASNLSDNNTLPSPNLPNNTIAYYWDNFAGGNAPLGTNDHVWVGVFGTAPNRQVWIRNWSYETQGRSFSYNNLVLEETTNKIYMVESYASSTGQGSMTLGIQMNNSFAVQTPSSPTYTNSAINSTWTNVIIHEYAPRLLDPNEAGISSVDAPSMPFASGMQTVTATLTNHGTAALTSANIDWSANGVTQTGTSFSGSLAPNATTSISLGMYNFTGATNLSVWSSLPNGVADPFTANDTTMVTLVPSLGGGTYTINGTQAASATNFVDFASAVTAMSGGISGAVTFNVAAGTYSEQVSIGSIIGISSTSTITFNGASAASTILTHDKTVRNSTLTLDGSSFITIKNMTIAATGGSDSWGIHMWNGANNITIDSNIVTTPIGTMFDVAGIMISGSETSDQTTGDVNDITISNNTVTGGERGISVYGNYDPTARSQNLTIHNNNIQNADDNGLYVTGYNNVTITDNYVDGLTNSFSDGMYSSDLENFTITGNRFKGGDNGLEARDYNFDNTVTSRSLIANNMFIGGDDGIYFDDVEDTDVFHNSCVAADYGVFVNDDANVDFRNNIFTSNGGDIAYYSLDASTTVTLDYNLYYTTGPSLAKFGTPTYADLAAFQVGQTTLNVNSVSGDPTFLNATGDLHIDASLVGTYISNDVGDNTVGILVDFDGDSRPIAGSTTVDIGADEFTPPSYCNPSPSSVDGSGIVNVTFGGINNTTGSEVGNYGNYSSLIGSVYQGGVASVDITYATGYTYGTKIWVDWNKDADFLDAGEEVYYGLSTNSSPTTLNASFTAPLNGVLGQYRMRIGGSDNNSGPSPCYTGSYASFEDYTLNLTAPPSCFPPAANLATAISTDTANVSWIGNGSATVYRVEWDTIGYAAGTARNMATVSNDTNYTISGLTAQSPYSWAVKAICSSTDSSTLSGNTFNTKIQGALGVNCSVGNPSTIFTEEFNNNTAGWTGNIGSSGGNWEIPNNATSPNTGADNAHSGSSYMNFEASGSTNAGSIVSPAIDLTAAQNDAELSFWMHAYGSNMGDLTVGIGTSATGTFTNVFSSSGQIQTAGSDPWINVGIDLASYVGQTIYVEFSMSNYSGFRSDMSIDLFEVSACPLLTPIALPITWDASTVDYSTIDFGGNASAVVADPTNATNQVLQAIKGVGAQTWAGSSFGDSLATAIPFATGTTTIRAVVWSATSGTPVLLKVEDQTNSAISSEILANTVTAGGWDTLSFNLSAGTPALNFTNTYNKMSMFFNFGVSPASAETYYVDYVDLIANVSPPPPAKAAIALPITWDDTANVNYNTIDFGGNNSSLAADPSNASNLVLQAIKGAGAQTWAGTTFGDSLASAIPFSAGNTTIRAVVYSPAAGLEVRLKVEDKTNSGISVESNVLTSVANGWDTLNFDMSAQSAGTAAINFANTYDKMSMFFNFGVSPASAETYYVDYVDFANPPPPVSSCPPGAVCATFASGDISTTDGAGYPTGSACPGTLTVNIPAGNRIDSVSTVYDMTAQNGAWMSEQTSWLSSSTTLGLEPASSAGTGNTAGTVSYSRNGLTFANGATGAVSLELNARRSWSSGTNPGCSTFNNKVDSSSWSVIAYFSPVPSCVEPLSLSASTINTTTVSVNWTDGNNPAATGGYEISYGLPSFVAGAGTQKIVNSTIDTITGLAASTTYDYYVRAICSSTSSSGWSLVGSFATSAGIPYAQSFETFPATSNSVGSSGWFNINGTTRPTWMSDAGGTGSTGTGPDFDHTLGNALGIYLFLETSGGSLGDRDTLTSPAISVGATQTSLTYTYWYHMAGASMGEMQVWVESNNVWDSLTTFSGAQQPATGSAWLLSSHVLTSYAGQDITLKFIGERGASFTGDMAIDDISVIETPNCLPPSALSSANPTLTSIDLDWVENNSATTWVIEYGPAGFIPGTGTNVTVTAKPFTLTGLTASTTYDFVVRADCSPGLSPNSFSSSFNTSNGVPYFVDFETFSSTSSQGWSQVAAGNPQWLLTSGGTPSSGTGPVVDHTTGTNTGKYVFLETSAGVAGDSDTLISAPIIVNANQTLLEFSFWYHFHGATIGSMEAWIIDSSGTLNLLGTIVGQQQAVQTDPWLKAKYIAAGYQGQAVRLAFVGIRGTSFTGDISIDDVRLDLAPPAEIGITNIVRPSSGCGLGADSVEIEITNFGSSSQTSFNVGYSLNGVAIAPETVTATLGVGMTMNYTFTTTASIGAVGIYDIITYSMLTGDADSSNDTLGTSLTSFANVAVFPYATSFETGNDSWFATGDASWELGTPAGFVIDTASNGTQAWVTDLDAAYGDGLNAFLTSPCFDFSNVANPAINLDIWYDIESRWDGAFMQATTDGGATWTTIGAEDDFLNWYNDTSRTAVDNGYSALGDSWTGDGSISGVNGTNGWIQASHELDGLGGQASVQLRFVFASDGNTNGDGLAVDNISIYDRDPHYVIGLLNTEDATGVADSLGVVAWTSGVVVGIDLDGNNGISFTIIDDDAAVTQEGMNIFNFNDVSNYVVTEGDEILVHGNILQYNGLTELSPDSIYVLSSGNPIPTPIVVTNLDETTESRWLSIPTSWVSLSTSGAFSSNVSLTNGTDTITMRIDSDTDINDSLTSSGLPIVPGDTICGLLGIGGQFDNSSPYTSGYQIFPMRWSDLTICRLSTGIENADLVSSEIALVPNPTNGTFEIRSNGFNNSTINISIRDLNGRIVASEFVNNASGNFRKSFDLNGQAKGIYFITILDGENVTNKKLILQ